MSFTNPKMQENIPIYQVTFIQVETKRSSAFRCNFNFNCMTRKERTHIFKGFRLILRIFYLVNKIF